VTRLPRGVPYDALMLPADRAEAALDRVIAHKPGGSRRSGQVEMVRAVADAIDAGTHLVCEAGPGTGKSFGYLIPAIVSGKKVVVATATKSLQDQLANKDLPFLAEHLSGLGIDFTWAVVKGRQNYLCRSRMVERLEEEGVFAQQSLLEGLTYDIPEGLRLLAEWADVHPTGDRDDLPDQLPEGLWESVSVTGMECPGKEDCPQGEACFAMAALEAAAHADVVVVNHHLYGNDLALGGAVVLPDHDVLIIDEAHRLEDTMASALGIELTEGRFWHVQRSTGGYLRSQSSRSKADTALQAFSDRTRLVRQSLDTADTGRIESLGEMGAILSASAAALSEVTKKIRATEPRSPGLLGARARALRLSGHLAGDIGMAVEPPSGYVAWIERDGGRSSYRIAPVEVGPVLADKLLSRVPVVLTSATLSVAGSLGPFARRLGFEEGAAGPPLGYRALRVGSPFDYQAQARVYVAARLPVPTSPDYLPRALSEVEALVLASGGRALVLTTSHRMLQAIGDHLDTAVPFEILRQGDLPKRRLVERFEEAETSVLVATMGFWEGLDVPGRSLELVVLDRLPFPRPDEPLWQARREAAESVGRSAFMTVDVPRAAMLLAQGAGRLIRTTEDRGVVAILDSRLFKRRYGRVLLTSLPPMPQTTSRAAAEWFLRSIGEDPGQHGELILDPGDEVVGEVPEGDHRRP
jgi:ATP-dependent DNA helicase DinG